MKLAYLLTASSAAIALFAGSPAVAQVEAEAQAEAAEPMAEMVELPAGPEGPALWKVADEDTTIYLFGTIHILPDEVQWYDAEIAEALTSSDTIVTELKMDPESERQLQQVGMQMGMYQDGTTLRSVLSEEQTATYEAALAGLGAPPAAFDAFEPWMAGLTITILPLMQQGYDLEAGVDKVLLGKAEGLNADALETAEYQLGLFDTLPQDKQVAYLMEAVEAIPEVKTSIDAMVAEWVEGDADGLAELINEDLGDADLAEALLYTRNANWAEWIETRLDTPGTVFMAVGAGHLAGERSVQAYLAERDIETTRVQ
ncbi:MAG: TraB/GumN family protein [Erythrobacter sp.]